MSPLRDTSRVVLVGLLVAAAIDFVGGWLHERAIAAAVVQLAIAEYGAGKLAIAWSPPSSRDPTAREIGLRLLRGVGIGAGVALALVLAGVIARTLELHAGELGIATLATGLAVAAFSAARDELLLRGVVRRALQKHAPAPVILAAMAAAAVARAWYAEGTTMETSVIAGGYAVIAGCIWLTDKGAWMAVGANAALGFVANAVLRGPIDARTSSGALGILGGRVSAITMAALALGALVFVWRRQRVE